MEKKKWYDKIWDWLKGDIKPKPIKSDKESKGLSATFTLYDESLLNKNGMNYSSLWVNEYSNPLLMGGYANQGSYAGGFALDADGLMNYNPYYTNYIYHPVVPTNIPSVPFVPRTNPIPLSLTKENIQVVYIFNYVQHEGDFILIKDIRNGKCYTITRETFLSLILKPKYPYIKTIKSI